MKQLSFDVTGPPTRSKGIDWDAQPLGRISDRVLAQRLGVNPESVRWARRRRNIKAFDRIKAIDWHRQPLGKKSDAYLARKLGVARWIVARERSERGIAAIVDGRGGVCECGSKRLPRRNSCARCFRLEGGGMISPAAKAILSELRVLGRSTWDAIRMSITGYSDRNLYRGMGELIASGMVKRHEVDVESGKRGGWGQWSGEGYESDRFIDTVAEFELCQRQA